MFHKPGEAVVSMQSAAPHKAVVRYALVAAGRQAPSDRVFMADKRRSSRNT